MEHDASSLIKYQLFMKWYNLYLCWNDNLLSKQVPYGACPSLRRSKTIHFYSKV